MFDPGPLRPWRSSRRPRSSILKTLIFQLFPLVFTCPYICKALRSLSSKIVVSPLFSIMRDQAEQLKRPGFSAATIEIGEESDEHYEKVIKGGCEIVFGPGFPNQG